MRRAREPKVVVVTGASAGVGRATAREFAARGARIGLVARGRAGLEGARDDVERAGGTALLLPLDVANAPAVDAAAERLERELGPIDVWVLLHDRSRVHAVMVQMPALNTPQFRWVKSRLPRRAQPVPPIFQPEVAARAIVWAPAHADREVWVGASTAAAIAGNAVIPRAGGAYLAWTGFDAQQTDGAPPEDRADNLWAPVDDTQDHGAHGDFDARARNRSYQFWARTHRGALVATGLAAGVGLSSLAWVRHRRSG